MSLVMMSVVGLLAFDFAVVLPVFAKVTLQGTGGTYGLLPTVLSVGSSAFRGRIMALWSSSTWAPRPSEAS